MSDTHLPSEHELKISLPGAADFDLLLAGLGEPEKQSRQVNHYYDTSDRALLGARMSLRFREEEGKSWFSLKRMGGWSEGYLRGEELEAEVREKISDPAQLDPYHWDLPPIRFLRRQFGALRLVWQGSIRNTRRVYSLGEGIRMEVDRTEFPGGRVEYEIEVECQDEEKARHLLLGLLDSRGVRWVPQTKTKQQRFLEYLAQGKGPARHC
jgi:uncharacterized protein YjbK